MVGWEAFFNIISLVLRFLFFEGAALVLAIICAFTRLMDNNSYFNLVGVVGRFMGRYWYLVLLAGYVWTEYRFQKRD